LVQSDQKENKSQQALHIIGHVVAESYANKRSMRGRGLKRYFIQGVFEMRAQMLTTSYWLHVELGKNI
jgi:hypothetical protein